jgi:hypothetical protein
LRWQVELRTTSPPEHDEQTAEALARLLEIHYGPGFKLTALRTKE